MPSNRAGALGAAWLWDGVRRISPLVLVVMWIVASLWSLFANYVLFRWQGLLDFTRSTHGLIGGTLVANLLGIAVIVVGILVAWGGARGPELGLRTGDLPRAAGVTVVTWLVLNALALGYDAIAGVPIQLDAVWDRPAHQLGGMIGQFFGNALFEEIVFRAVLVTQIARWLDRGTAATRRRALGIALVASQLIFMAAHVFNRLAAHMWATPGDAIKDLSLLFVMGLLLATVWLRTRNLLIAVGLHALSNISGALVPLPGWLGPAGMFAVFLVLVIRGPARPSLELAAQPSAV